MYKDLIALCAEDAPMQIKAMNDLGKCLNDAGWEGLGCRAALEATQGQIYGFFSQLPYKCYLEEVASVGD